MTGFLTDRSQSNMEKMKKKDQTLESKYIFSLHSALLSQNVPLDKKQLSLSRESVNYKNAEWFLLQGEMPRNISLVYLHLRFLALQKLLYFQSVVLLLVAVVVLCFLKMHFQHISDGKRKNQEVCWKGKLYFCLGFPT